MSKQSLTVVSQARFIYLLLTLILLISLSACGSGTVGNSDSESFKIVSINPDSNENGINLDSLIEVEFNKRIAANTVSEHTFWLLDEYTHEKVNGSINFSDNQHKITFKPSALFFNRHYSVTVHHTITDTNNIHLSTGTKNWKFFTENKLPVFHQQPTNGKTEVNINTNISVGFNRNILSASVNASNFKVIGPNGVVNGIFSIEPDHASFKPNQALALSSNYTVVLSTGILDNNGMPMFDTEFIWTFSTRATIPSTFHLGTQGNDEAHAFAVDNQNNIYVVGQTEGKFPNQSNAGQYDAFVAKYNNQGSQEWVTQFGSPLLDVLNGLIISTNGDIYVAGHSDKPNFIGDGDDQSDFLFARFNSNGTKLWQQSIGANDGHDLSRGLVVDSLNNFYIAGATMGTLPGNQRNFGEHDIALIKYDQNGVFLWAKQYGTEGNEIVEGVSLINDTIYIVVTTINITHPVPVHGHESMLPIFENDPEPKIYAFDTAGTNLWDKKIGEENLTKIADMASSSSGNLFVVAQGTDETVTSGVSESIFIYKLDNFGNVISPSPFKTQGQSFFDAQALAIDTAENMYLSGFKFNSEGSSSHGAGSMGGPPAKEELQIKKLNSNGLESWNRIIASENHTTILDMMVTDTGETIATGFTHGELEHSTMIGTQDAFILRLDINGVVK